MEDQASPTSTQQTIVSTHPYLWLTFEYILMFIALSITTGSVYTLLGHYIDRWVPGLDVAINNSVYSSSYLDFFTQIWIRFNMASAITGYLVFAALYIHTRYMLLRRPQLLSLRAKKTIVYIALTSTIVNWLYFVGSIIFSLINGDLSTNVLLHVVVQTILSVLVFITFFSEILHDKPSTQ